MSMQIRSPIAAILGSFLFIGAAHSATSDYYAGKTIRLVVGYAPGGGYDFYADRKSVV